MGNQMIMLLVVGGLLGLFGGNAVSKLNPFKAGKVAIAKHELQKEEYFKDKVKGVEYRITERSKGKTPVIEKKSFIDKSFTALVKIGVIFFLLSIFLGVNVIKYIRKLKTLSVSSTKALTQMIVGTQKAKPKMNGQEKILSTELATALDEDSKKLVREIKSEKSI